MIAEINFALAVTAYFSILGLVALSAYILRLKRFHGLVTFQLKSFVNGRVRLRWKYGASETWQGQEYFDSEERACMQIESILASPQRFKPS